MTTGAGDIYALGLSVDPSGAESGAARVHSALDGIGTKGKAISSDLRAAFDSMGASFSTLGSHLVRLGTQFGEALLGFEGIKKFVTETSEAQFATAQLEAAVRSTGGAAERSVEQLQALGEALQRTTTYTNEQVERADALLLTFDKIKGVQFDQATEAVVNLAARLGGDLTGAALQVGKALQDPEQGLLALRRAGVSFTQGQQDVIKSLFDAGKTAEAQTLILKELEREFGGSAAAARDTLGGALKGLANDFNDLFKSSKGGTTAGIDAINGLDSALVAIKPHMGELAALAGVVGAVVGGRWLAEGIESLTALGSRLIVARAETAAYRDEELRLAQAKVDTTTVELRQATIEAQLARERAAQVVTTGGVSVQESAAAINAVATTRATLAARTEAAAAASVKLVAAEEAVTIGGRVAAGATSLFSGALKLLGGAEGAAIFAGLALIEYAIHKHAEAAREAKENLDRYRESLTDIGVEAKRTQIALNEASIAQEQAYLNRLQATRSQLPSSGYGADAAGVSQLDAQITGARGSIDALTNQNKALTQSLFASGATAEQVSEKFKLLVAEHQQQIDKLQALNAAYGQSDNAIKLLSISLDGNKRRIDDEKKALEEHLNPQQRSVLLALDETQTQLELTAARLAQRKELEANVRAYTAANSASITAAANEVQLANLTNAGNRAQQDRTAAVQRLASQVSIAIATNGDYATASRTAIAADVAAQKAANDLAAEREKVRSAQQADVESQAAYAKFQEDASKIGVDAAAKEYAATTQRIQQVRLLRDATIDANTAAANSNVDNAQTQARVAFADSVNVTVASLATETAILKQEAEAKRQGQSAIDALAVSRAAEAAQQQLETEAAKNHTTATVDEIAAIRRAAEERERASQALARVTLEESAAIQITKNFLRSVQGDVGNFFVDIFQDGGTAAEKFWRSFKDLAIKTFGELISANLLKSVVGQGQGGILSSLGGLFGGGGSQAPATVPGTPTISNALGLNYGASSAGSASIAQPFALAATAAIGVATAFNALIGTTIATRESLDQFLQGALSIASGLRNYEQSLNAVPGDATTAALNQNANTAAALRAQAETTFAGKNLQGQREAILAQIAADEAKGQAKIREQFLTSISQQLNAIQGPAGAYANQLADIEAKYTANKASAAALGVSLDQVTELYEQQKAAATAAYEEGQKQLQSSLDARQAYAQGLTAEGDAIVRRAQEDKELFDATQAGYSDAQKAQLKYIQSLEDEAARKKALADATQTLAEQTAAGPKGSLADQQKAGLQPLLDKQAADAAAYQAAVGRLNADLAAGADAATIYADNQAVLTAGIVSAGDAAAIAAKQFQDAAAQMDAAASQIEQDVSFGATSGSQGLAYEKQAFGFTGLSDDQIRALYTAFSGSPLTNEQIQTNKNIETYFRDAAQWGQQVTNAVSNASSGGGPRGSTSAIVNAAQGLTDQVGNRMADYLAAIELEEKQGNAYLASIAGGRAFPVNQLSSLQPVPLPYAPTSFGAGQASLDTAALDRIATKLDALANLTGGGTTQITIRVDRDPNMDTNAYIDRIASRLEVVLATRARNAQLRAGSTILIGS